MDDQIRKLINRYKSGDESVGLMLLRQMVRSGLVREENVLLAAAYRYPLAVTYIGRTPTEEEAFTLEDLEDTGPRPSTSWPLEYYVQRNLAAISQAFLHISPYIDTRLRPEALSHASYEASMWIDASRDLYVGSRDEIVDWLEREPSENIDEATAREIKIRGWMRQVIHSTNNQHQLDFQEIYYLLMATSATLWTIRSGLEKPGLIPQGVTLAPLYSALAVAYCDERIFQTPVFEDESEQRISKAAIEEVYGAICKSMAPIVLKPFPV